MDFTFSIHQLFPAHLFYLDSDKQYLEDSSCGLRVHSSIPDVLLCVENYLCHVYDYFHRQLLMRRCKPPLEVKICV